MGINIEPKFKTFNFLKTSPYFPVWLSWMTGIGLSAVASGVVWHWEMTQLQAEFPQRANNLAFALQQNLDESLQVTRALGAFYDASERVTRDEFSRFSQVFLPRTSAILELGWLEEISEAERSDYEKNRQLEYNNFKIRDCGVPGQSSVSESRQEHYPIVYLETPTQYHDRIGCDQAANPMSRLSIVQAKTFEITIATPPFQVSNPDRSIFEIYYPVYEINLQSLNPIQSLEKQLKGLIYASIDLQELIVQSIHVLNLENLNFYVYDLSFDRLDSSLSKSLYQEEPHFLVFYDSAKRKFINDPNRIPPLKTGTSHYCPYNQEGTTCVRTLNVADREWSVLILPPSNTRKVASPALGSLIIGLCLTSIVATYLTTITQQTLKTEAVNRSLNTELEITHKVHRMLLPKAQDFLGIEGLEIAGFMEPAASVGGDYYDVLYQDGRLIIGIGDVTGHGLESGVLTIVVQTAVQTLFAHRETDAKKILETLNQVIFGNVRRMNSDKILTLALLEYQDGKLHLSGQHEEAIVIRQDGQIERIDTIDLGFPIGLEEDISQFVHCTSIQLNVGDIVILYTDGIPEAENLQGKRYGIDRLCHVASWYAGYSAQKIQEAIIADLKQYIGTQKIYDDITLLVLKQL